MPSGQDRRWIISQAKRVNAMQKIYMTKDNKATLACPACERSRSIDASPYITHSRVVRMRVKCPCGRQTTVELERRRHFRKPVRLKGSLAKIADRVSATADPVAVLDLSRAGVRLRLRQERSLRIGDRLLLQFQLDDAKQSTVRKESVVRRINGADLGAEFTPADPNDPNTKAIGFYLFAA